MATEEKVLNEEQNAESKESSKETKKSKKADKKADAFARHNGGVDRVEGLISQALLTGFRGIICVTLEVAWSPNHHQERPPQEGLAVSATHGGEGLQAKGAGPLGCSTGRSLGEW